MAEASTDILVDEDGIHVSNCCVKICNVCNSEDYTITYPISLILVFGGWHLWKGMGGRGGGSREDGEGAVDKLCE